MTVAVGVATYRRPDRLSELLDGLARLRFELSPSPEIVVIVADNDADRSAEPICRRRDGRPWPMRYQVVERRGIPFVRNRILAELPDDADLVAFIDDDEVPDPAWLDRLLAAQQAFAADVVAGPVLPRLPNAAPDWVERGRFFERPRRPTGSPLETAATNNVLVRRGALPAGPCFDPRFVPQGEDSHLFRQLARSGHRLVWCDEAVVYESVPLERTRLGWLLSRAFRTRYAYTLSKLDLERSGRVVARRLAAALGRAVQGALLLPFAVFRRREHLVTALRHLAGAAGTLACLARHGRLAFGGRSAPESAQKGEEP